MDGLGNTEVAVTVEQPQRRARDGWLKTILANVGSVALVITIICIPLRPYAVEVLAVLMTPTIKAEVRSQNLPMSNGFRVLLQANVSRISNDITDMEFRKGSKPAQWQLSDEKALRAKLLELEEQQSALLAIKMAELGQVKTSKTE